MILGKSLLRKQLQTQLVCTWSSWQNESAQILIWSHCWCWPERATLSLFCVIKRVMMVLKWHFRKKIFSLGGRHSSVDPSEPTNLRPRCRVPSKKISAFSILILIVGNVKRTKINQKRSGLAQFLYKIFSITSVHWNDEKIILHVIPAINFWTRSISLLWPCRW